MSGLSRSLLWGAAMALALAAPAGAGSDRLLDPANFDPKAQPCDDYFQFATGGWQQTHPIPPALSRWGTFDKLGDDNVEKMRAVLEKLIAQPDLSDADFPRIANFYKSCMDEDRIERDGEAWLKARLAPIDALKTRADAIAAISRLQADGLSVPFSFGSMPDGHDSDREVAAFWQAGLSLPNRDYYTRDDARSKTLRGQLVDHVARMFVLVGETQLQAAADATAVLDLETQLALASRSPVDLRDTLKNYNPTPVATVQRLTPDMDWQNFLRTVAAPPVDSIDVGQPEFLQGLGTILATAQPNALKAYLRWHVMASGGDGLPKRFVDERFAFRRLMSGAQELRPRWQRCVYAVTGAMQDAAGKAFVKNLVPAGTKERMVRLVHNMRLTLRQDIRSLDWMGPETKKLATEKLDRMIEHVAYPDKPIDYSALSITPDMIYGDALLAVRRFEKRRDLDKIGRPTDHHEWHMSAMTTNAYYEPEDNSITFPAGILMPPFFDVRADDAVNYGGIGVVIGHELTHGFDDEGRHFDATGNLKDWWTPDDAENFGKLGRCIADEYDGFVAIDDQHENGKLEEGEAIADLGGVTIAHRAFLKTPQARAGKRIDGMTPDQRFYASFAQIWASNIRPEEARRRALTDPHPLSKFRVIGTLGNVEGFAKAYGCKADAPMVRRPRCKIW